MMRKLIAAGLLTVTLAVLGGCAGSKNAGESKPAGESSQPEQYPSGEYQPAPTQPAQAQPSATAGTQYQIVAAESVASYSVHEKFLDQDLNNTAVGKTSAIKGALVLDGGKLQPSTVTVDVRTLKSDKSRRDDQLKNRALETNKYASAEFAITGTEGAVTFAEGQEVAFKLAGKLKLHGAEKDVVWDAKGKLQGDAFHLTATITFKMGDFKVEPPNILNLISVDDTVQLNVDLAAKKG